MLMQLLQGKRNFTCISLSCNLIQLVLPHIFLHVSTFAQFHQDEQMREILEAVIALENKGMFNFGEDLLLRSDIPLQLAVDDQLLVDFLHGVDETRFLLTHQKHLCERSLSQLLQLVVIFNQFFVIQVALENGLPGKSNILRSLAAAAHDTVILQIRSHPPFNLILIDPLAFLTDKAVLHRLLRNDGILCVGDLPLHGVLPKGQKLLHLIDPRDIGNHIAIANPQSGLVDLAVFMAAAGGGMFGLGGVRFGHLLAVVDEQFEDVGVPAGIEGGHVGAVADVEVNGGARGQDDLGHFGVAVVHCEVDGRVAVHVLQVGVGAPEDQGTGHFDLVGEGGFVEGGSLHGVALQIDVDAEFEQQFGGSDVVLADAEVQQTPPVHILELAQFQREFGQQLLQQGDVSLDDQFQKSVFDFGDGFEVLSPDAAGSGGVNEEGGVVADEGAAVLGGSCLDVLYHYFFLVGLAALAVGQQVGRGFALGCHLWLVLYLLCGVSRFQIGVEIRGEEASDGPDRGRGGDRDDN